MRVVGLAVAAMIALTAPVAGHAAPSASSMTPFAPEGAHYPGLGRVWLGLAPDARPLEPVEGRMSPRALCPPFRDVTLSAI